MTRAAKITYAMAALIGLASGFVLGFHMEALASKSFYEVQRMAAAFEITNFSYVQYRRADAQHAKEALLTCARFLEEMERLKPDRTQEADLAIAYTRLALLEDAAQNASQSQSYMNQAMSWRKTNGALNASDAEIKAGQRRIDEALDR
jgi:hypothetical protein